ncbi:MAG: hypothetical protein ACRDXD_02400 [Acidimicrobiia bacterium]
MVSVYSLRATEVPSVSTPLSWLEVEQAVGTADPDRLRWSAWIDWATSFGRWSRPSSRYPPRTARFGVRCRRERLPPWLWTRQPRQPAKRASSM